MFPIKYIDNNLVWNKDNEVFAYYELIPYNYSFLSPEQKYLVHDSFRQLIAQSREGKIHALQIATESSIRSIQEQSKKLVTGKLREVAIQKIDDQTEALVSMIGDNQVDYRFFLGFKLMVTEDEVNLKNIKKSVFLTFREFLNEVRHTLMNDFVSMSNDEVKCSFARQDTLSLQIRIDHQNNGCIIVQVTNNRRHGFLTRKLRCPVPPVTRNDFITTIGVRTDNRRGENSEISDALRSFHHFFIINHTEGVSLERM